MWHFTLYLEINIVTFHDITNIYEYAKLFGK